MKGEVYKATITITVMGFAKNEKSFREELDAQDIVQIMEEADSGSYVAGSMEIAEIVQIERDNIENELGAVGSDISFFESELEED